MSTDDIVFGEVAFREPQRLRRPDRDRRFACIAYETPGPGDLPIFLDRGPADAIERHALRDTSVELGGILLGRECVDEETGEAFVWVTESLEAKHYENTQASFTYTHDSWEEITRERDRRFPDLDIVGWYHTHPDYGIFLSGHDLFIQRHFFDQPLQVAYVVDPIRQGRGFFRWRGDELEQVGGYYLTAGRDERGALARLVNDLEGIPNTQNGGGALSPRLEAELIAMLSRPHAPPAADRAQGAAVFAVLGAVLGALGFAGALWLNALAQGLRQQSDEVHELRLQLAEEAKSQREALDVERVLAKEAALDALLADVHLDGSDLQFKALYEEAVRQRNEALKQVERLQTDRLALNTLGTKLRSERSNLAKDLNAAERKIEEVKAGVAEDLDELKATNAELKADLHEAETILHESKAGTLARKYDLAWYLAVAGWSVAALLALGLVVVIARNPPPEPPAEPDGPRDEPTHRIT